MGLQLQRLYIEGIHGSYYGGFWKFGPLKDSQKTPYYGAWVYMGRGFRD